jgi:hypothetical protein
MKTKEIDINKFIDRFSVNFNKSIDAYKLMQDGYVWSDADIYNYIYEFKNEMLNIEEQYIIEEVTDYIKLINQI